MKDEIDRLEARADELREELRAVENRIAKLKDDGESGAVAAWRRAQALAVVRSELS